MFKNPTLSFRAATTLAVLFIALSVGGCSGNSSSGSVDYSGLYTVRIEEQNKVDRLEGEMSLIPNGTVLMEVDHSTGPTAFSPYMGSGVWRGDGSTTLTLDFVIGPGLIKIYTLTGAIIASDNQKTLRNGTITVDGQPRPELSWSALCSSGC